MPMDSFIHEHVHCNFTTIFFTNKCSFKFFIHCSAIKDWNTSEITDMSLLFYNRNCNPDISGWDVSKVTNFVSNNLICWKKYIWYFELMFWFERLLFSSVYSQQNMFNAHTSFNRDLSKWDVASGTNFVSGLDYWIDIIIIKMMLFEGKTTSCSYW